MKKLTTILALATTLFCTVAPAAEKRLVDENAFLQQPIDFARPADKKQEAELLRPPAKAYPFPGAKVDFSTGVPEIICNGEKSAYITYAIMSGSNGNLLSARQLRESGVKLFMVDLSLTDKTYGAKSRDASPQKMFKRFKKNMVPLLKAAPDAKVIIRFWLSFEGDDFQKLYPDALLAESSGNTLWKDNNRRGNYLNEWRLYMASHLRQFLELVGDSEFAPHIVGCYLGAMYTGEWCFWKDTAFAWDYSKTRQEAFRMYLEMKYGRENFPALKKLWNVTTDEELFRLPTMEERRRFPWAPCSRVSDYLQCLNLPVTNAAKFMAKVIKAVSYGKLLAGMEILNELNTFNSNGTVYVNQLLDCPEIDFLGAPSPYDHRGLGVFSTPRSATSSLQKHKKFFFSEDDLRTHITYGTPAGQGSPPALPEDAAQTLRRQGLSAMLKGYWMYLMEFGARWFTHPAYLREIRDLNLLYPIISEMKQPRTADIALVSDQDSQLYGNYFGNATALYKTVAPYIGADHDYYELRDFLDQSVYEKYKLVIFLNLNALSDTERTAIDKMKSGNRTLFFFHDPGRTDLSTNTTQWEEKMSRLVGMTLKKSPVKVQWGNAALSPVPQGIRKAFGTQLSFANMGSVTQVDAGNLAAADAANGSMSGGNNIFGAAVADPEAIILGKTGDGVPRFAMKQFKDWTSIYSATCLLPANIIRAAAEKAGCHIYNRSGDVIFQRGNLFAIHCVADGEHELLLKSNDSVLDFYADKILTPQNRRIAFTAKKGETKLFCQGDFQALQAGYKQSKAKFDADMKAFKLANPAPSLNAPWFNYTMSNRRPKPYNYGPFKLNAFTPTHVLCAGPFDSAEKLYATAESLTKVTRSLNEEPLYTQSNSTSTPLAFPRQQGKDINNLVWNAFRTNVWCELPAVSKGQCGLYAFYLNCDAPKQLEVLFASSSNARLFVNGKKLEGKQGQRGKVVNFSAGDTLFVIAAENITGTDGFTIKFMEVNQNSKTGKYSFKTPSGVTVRLAPTGYNAKLSDVFNKRPLTAAPEGFTTSLTRQKRTFSLKEKISVEESATYFCNVKAAASADAKGILYVGAECYGKDGKRIWPENVYTVRDSQTVLAEKAAAGSKAIVVKIAEGWVNSASKFVVFNVKADRSDLPNRTAIKIEKAVKEGNKIVVTLSKPLKVDYLQGTAVRLHSHGSIYTILGAKSFKSGSTFSLNTKQPQSKFMPGTAAFIPCIFTNANGEVKLSNIEFGTVEKKAVEK